MNSATEAVGNISLPSTREAAEAEVGFFDGFTLGGTKWLRDEVGIGNGGLALCGPIYNDAGIAGTALGALAAVYTPEGLLVFASRSADASAWLVEHGDDVLKAKDFLVEVARHVIK